MEDPRETTACRRAPPNSLSPLSPLPRDDQLRKWRALFGSPRATPVPCDFGKLRFSSVQRSNRAIFFCRVAGKVDAPQSCCCGHYSACARPSPRAAWSTCPLCTLSSRTPASLDALLCTGSSCRRSLPARSRSTRCSRHRSLRSRARGGRRAYLGPSPALASASGVLRPLGGVVGERRPSG